MTDCNELERMLGGLSAASSYQDLVRAARRCKGVDEIVHGAGFKMLERELFAVKDYGTEINDPTVDVAYVCEAV